MSRTVTFRHDVDGVPTDVTSVVLRDAAGTYGIQRADTGATVVAAGTPLVRTSAGRYQYTLASAVAGVSYRYRIEYIYNGQTRRAGGTLTPAAGVSPALPLPVLEYVDMGIELVSCGDAALAEFLTAQSALVWAMQLRRGVALDLRFQYYVLDLVTLALDHVRALVDTARGSQTSTETGYSNSTNTSDSSATTSRTRAGSGTSSSSGAQSFSRVSARTSSAQGATSSTQSASRTGSGTDTSTQAQTSKTTRSTSHHIETVTTPVSGNVANSDDYRLSDSVIHNNMEMREKVRRFSVTVLGVGNFSGQTGYLDDDPEIAKSKETYDSGVGNVSSIDFVARDQGRNYALSGQALSGKGRNASGALTGGGGGKLTTDQTTVGTGTRTNAVHRSTSGTGSGSATMTSSSTMASSSHEESHRESESLAHSESAGHGESASSAVSHRESAGASQLAANGTSDMTYYSQIFESLTQLRKDTLEQIRALEQQVSLAARTIVARLTVRTPQAALVVNRAGNELLTQTPNRWPGPFSDGFNSRTVH